MLEWKKCDRLIEYIDLGLVGLEVWVNTFKTRARCGYGCVFKESESLHEESVYTWGVGDSEVHSVVGTNPDFEEAKKDALRYVQERLHNILAELPVAERPYIVLIREEGVEEGRAINEEQLEATKRELERWKRGKCIEGDYVCENGDVVDDPWAGWEKTLDRLETRKQDYERLISELGFERALRCKLQDFIAAFHAEWEDELPGAAAEQLSDVLDKEPKPVDISVLESRVCNAAVRLFGGDAGQLILSVLSGHENSLAAMDRALRIAEGKS